MRLHVLCSTAVVRAFLPLRVVFWWLASAACLPDHAGALCDAVAMALQQELMQLPLCGFSQLINKYADGSGTLLAYEIHTPRLGPDEVSGNCQVTVS
jgi:hypothetical protein